MEDKRNYSEQELEELTAYFDSDEFLEEPWVQEIAKELDREKVLLPDPIRLQEAERAWKLLDEIVRKEQLDAEMYAKQMDLPATRAAIVLTTDSLNISPKTIFLFSQIMELCDGVDRYPRTDDRITMTLYFEDIFQEVHQKSVLWD